MRNLVRAAPGKILVNFDYKSGIAIAAYLSQDPVMKAL